MNLVVFGEDIYTAYVIESLVNAGHHISLLVSPDNPGTNHKVLAEVTDKHHIEFIKDENVNSKKIENRIKKINPDVIIAAHLRKILRKEIFSLAKKAAINIHPSLLPKYRGLSPQHQAIMHGDAESGVTVHYIDSGVDTGEIIIQKKFPIAKDDYILQVQSKMLAIYKTIVAEALDLLADESFKPARQDLSQLSYFGPLKKSDREIDFSKTVIEVYNLIRAVSLPYKGAFYKNYILWTAEIPDQADDLMKKYKDMGLYHDEKTDTIIIRLKDGFLLSEDFEINKK